MQYSHFILCSGTPSERLEWFKIIDTTGAELTKQKLRNAAYYGPWLSDAKRHLSKTGCVAYAMASDYVSGKPIRQEYLEKALRWISKDNIEEYMGTHQYDQNANELWNYFRSVINWVETTFITKKPGLMKKVDGVAI